MGHEQELDKDGEDGDYYNHGGGEENGEETGKYPTRMTMTIRTSKKMTKRVRLGVWTALVTVISVTMTTITMTRTRTITRRTEMTKIKVMIASRAHY